MCSELSAVRRVLMPTLLWLFACAGVASASDWDRFNWETSRPAGNTVVRAMAAFGNNIYVGTEFPAGTAQLWRYDGANWTNITPAWPATTTAAASMMVFSNLLFVGTQDAVAGAQVWQMTAAEVWAQEAPGWVVPANWSARSMCLFDSCLYVGTENAGGCKLWCRTGAGAWNEVVVNAFGTNNNTAVASMASFGSFLYAGTRNANNGAKLWRVSAGLVPALTNHTGIWTATTTEVSSLRQFGVYLYVGTERTAGNGGAEIWETPNGVAWLLVVANGFGNVDNDRMSAMHVAGVNLYVGSRNNAGGEACALYSTSDGINWWLEDDDMGLDNAANKDVCSFTTFDDRVYCGTSNATGSEVYRTAVVHVTFGGGGGHGGGGGICLVASLTNDRRNGAGGWDGAHMPLVVWVLGCAAVLSACLRRSRKSACLIVLGLALFSAGCTPTTGLVSPAPQPDAVASIVSGVSNAYRDRVKAKLECAGEARGELLRLLTETEGQQREWAEFLVANMPPRDLGAVAADVVLDHLRSAEAAQSLFPWTKSVPRDVFLHYVLPYRVSQEPMEKWRGYLLAQLQPRLQNTGSMAEAVLEVNRWAGENIKFKPTEFRDQAPLETLRAGYGRCEEMTIAFIAAARSVGLPARCASTPWWATCDNNHAWVEVWADGRWWYLGACEPAATL
ncbi:MAG: transglutaminase-like domain-containing protein, partial [Planctomycetota bacterium]|nr:transglutaminase-like domain-containing protein [Planctomycetota bacterium]